MTKNSSSAQNHVSLSKKGRGLGRGLDALFVSNMRNGASLPSSGENDRQSNTSEGRVVQDIMITNITPNINQPRKYFDDDSLQDLSQSIKENGLLQPILLQQIDDGYQIIAGERRFRASKMAGLESIPSILIDTQDQRKILEIALLENIQRLDLSVIEEARAYTSLIDDFGCTHEDLSKTLGKSRSHITNALRLLKLPESVLESIGNNEITFGHAKVIAGTDDPSLWSQIAIEKGLTVRMLEREIAESKMQSNSHYTDSNNFNSSSSKNNTEAGFSDFETGSGAGNTTGSYVARNPFSTNSKGTVSFDEEEQLVDILNKKVDEISYIIKTPLRVHYNKNLNSIQIIAECGDEESALQFLQKLSNTHTR